MSGTRQPVLNALMEREISVAAAMPASSDASAKRYYEQMAIARFGDVWARRKLILASVALAIAIAQIVLSVMSVRYTGSAIIRPAFVQGETAVLAKSRPVAAMDAAAVVESAARLIQSRAVASAVVTHLGLDRESAFSRPPLWQRVFDEARKLVGINVDAASTDRANEHDAAVAQLLGRTKVSNDARSYLITISVTAGDPGRAAMLANALALEYARQQAIQQVAESYAAAEHQLTDIATVYGPRHPSFLAAKANVAELRGRLNTLRDPTTGNKLSILAGFDGGISQSLIPAEKVTAPSGPNHVLVLIMAALGGLGLAIALAMFLDWRRRNFMQVRPHPLRAEVHQTDIDSARRTASIRSSYK